MRIMPVVLLVLGILATGAGIVAVGFGIPISEFSLGNTLIVSGAVALSAGLVLIGLAAAVSQLTQIAEALRPRAGARPLRLPDSAEPAAPTRAQAKLAPVEEPVAEPVGEPAGDLSTTAIERLRSSLVRPERKGVAEGEAPDEAVPGAAPVAARTASAGASANGAAGAGAAESSKKARLDFLFRSKQRAAPAESFDKVWPKRPQRGPNAAAGQDDDDRSPPRQETTPEPEARPTAILKSGVVDGMAYTLYVDGSIEAQLPQGTVRFGSIAELRAHIENNS